MFYSCKSGIFSYILWAKFGEDIMSEDYLNDIFLILRSVCLTLQILKRHPKFRKVKLDSFSFGIYHKLQYHVRALTTYRIW